MEIQTNTHPISKENRLDRINLLEFGSAANSGGKILYSCIIQDAIYNYLYAFVEKNGISIDEFFSAWQYLFKITSGNKENWNNSRVIKQSYLVEGKKVTSKHTLTDEDLKLMCFDSHYDCSGMSKHIHIDKFRSKLKEKRKTILTNSWNKVQSYVSSTYQTELNKIAYGQALPLQIWNEDLLTVLIDPPTPLHLANTFYIPKKLKATFKPKQKVSRPKVQKSENIQEDLGPLFAI